MSARNRFGEGEKIADPLKASSIFPPMVIQMISVGKKPANLEKSCLPNRRFLRQEVDTAVESHDLCGLNRSLFASWAFVIGAIVICMFLADSSR